MLERRLSVLGLVLGAALLLGQSACYPHWPKALPKDSLSRQRLQPGPHPVGKKNLFLVDQSRTIPAAGQFPGASARPLESTIWWPRDASGPHPLVLYSHGFMSFRTEAAYLSEHLASHGYVVIAADFPRTYYFAEGGPSLGDVVNQPADLSFLIDTVLDWKDGEQPFAGTIDEQRIAAVGLSLGGFTTTLAAFHPQLRDPRIRVAVSIAGPTALFLPSFFRQADVPFLMIAGTLDAMVDFQQNAARVPKLVRRGGLVRIEGGSHTAFSGMADPYMRPLPNPDYLGCQAIDRWIVKSMTTDEDFDLGGAKAGIDSTDVMSPPCQRTTLKRAMNPLRQHWVTTLATSAFLESQLATSAGQRKRARRYLRHELPRDFPEVSFEKARAGK